MIFCRRVTWAVVGVLSVCWFLGVGLYGLAVADEKTIVPEDTCVVEMQLTKLYVGQGQFVGFSGQGASFPVLPVAVPEKKTSP